LVIPGYYGTNCVKWICRLVLMARRPTEFQTIALYSDPNPVAGSSENATKPVWAVAPESIIVFPAHRSFLAPAETEIWGWAWSDRPVRSIEVSVDGGRNWTEALLEPPAGHSWQRFSFLWSPARAGSFELCCRATDASGKAQPINGARNAVHSINVMIAD
jgi:sulfane dehydrogenase subunit SoxC